MSIGLIKQAARLWNARKDSAQIAAALELYECTVYANLWRIRAQAARYRMAA